jgi:hypothetical protein
MLSAPLLAAYGVRARLTPHPLLNLGLFRFAHLPRGGERRFLHAAGIGRHPVPVSPCSTRSGSASRRSCRGLLVLPQAVASIGLKAFMPAILARLGYRNVLVATRSWSA